jgi:hypothetical protein
MEDKIETK